MNDFSVLLTATLSNIRVPIHWAVLFRQKWTVRRVDLNTTGRTLSDLFCPWYMDNGTPLHRQRDPQKGDTPITIADASADTFTHPWFSKARMDQFTNEYLQRGSAEELCPAYNVGQGRILLLDGCHHSIALVRSKVPYRIDLLIFEGPVDSSIGHDIAVFA